MAKPDRVMLPQIKLVCPLTDWMSGSIIVEKHFCTASLCSNGSVHIYCVVHMFKGFVSHPKVLEAANGAPKAKAVPAARPDPR